MGHQNMRPERETESELLPAESDGLCEEPWPSVDILISGPAFFSGAPVSRDSREVL